VGRPHKSATKASLFDGQFTGTQILNVKVHGKASCRDYEAQPLIVGQNRHLYRRVGELKVAKAAGFPLIEKPNIIVSNEVGGLF
jgi:hypothetical protein